MTAMEPGFSISLWRLRTLLGTLVIPQFSRSPLKLVRRRGEQLGLASVIAARGRPCDAIRDEAGLALLWSLAGRLGHKRDCSCCLLIRHQPKAYPHVLFSCSSSSHLLRADSLASSRGEGEEDMTFTVTSAMIRPEAITLIRRTFLGLYAEAKSLDALVGIIKDVAPGVVHNLGAKVVIAPGIVVCNRILAKERAW
jgi:hypothetical protein